MPDKFRVIQSQITQLKAQHAQTEQKLTTLEKQVKLARGTRDIKVSGPTLKQLEETLIRLMRERPMSLQELSDATKADKQAISNLIVALKKGDHRILNVGEPRRAEWYYVPKYSKDGKRL